MRVATTDNSKYLCAMKVLLATLSLLAAEPSHAEPELAEPSIDTLRIEEVEVVASLKHDYNRQKAISAIPHKAMANGITDERHIAMDVNSFQPCR